MIQFLLVLAGAVAVYSAVLVALMLRYRKENRAGAGLHLLADVHTLRPVGDLDVAIDVEQPFVRPRLSLVK